jgi:hypothetical protein
MPKLRLAVKLHTIRNSPLLGIVFSFYIDIPSPKLDCALNLSWFLVAEVLRLQGCLTMKM